MKSELPRVAQSLDFTCGPACFDSMYQHLTGQSLGELYFAERLGTLSLGYTIPERIAELAIELGFLVEFKRNAETDDLKAALNRGRVVFVTWWDEDAGHYSLVKSMSSFDIVLMDPWQARTDADSRLELSNFENHWRTRGNVLIAIGLNNIDQKTDGRAGQK